jgi:hypothetical protein
MSAADLARTITPHALQTAPDAVERAALDAAPAYAARVDEIGRSHGDRLAGARTRRLEELRTADPAAARALAPTWRAWLGLLGAYIAAAAGFALYFSRAQLDVVDITPIAMGLVVLTALLYLFAALPLARTAPPAANISFGGWILTVLTGASVGYAAYAVLRFAPEATGWLLVGGAGVAVILALAVGAAVVRGSVPADRRAATDARVAEFPAALREDAQTQLDEAVAAVRAAYDAQPEQTRTAIERDLAAASDLLRERGLTFAPAEPPGARIVRKELAVVAMGIGVRDLGVTPAANA